MKHVINSLLVPKVAVFVLALFCVPAMVQITTSIWHLPAFYSQPLVVQTISPTTEDILIDDFEYWDSPYNHGWIQLEQAYPVYGF